MPQETTWMHLAQRCHTRRRLFAFWAICASLVAIPACRAQDVLPADAVSRSVAVLNEAPPTDAVSREVGTLNDGPPPDAVSREVGALNDLSPAPADAVSREIAVYVPPYSVDDALRAVRIWGGIAPALPGDFGRINLVVIGTSLHAIDLMDAARVVRKATGLDP